VVQKEHSKSRGLLFFLWKRILKSLIWNRIICTPQTGMAVNRVEFVSDSMSYVIVRVCWCTIIFLNVHAPSEEKSDDSKDSFYEELNQDFFIFRSTK
jgi:hypothetical protein